MVSYWGILDECASGCRPAMDEDVNAYGMSLASEHSAMQATVDELFPFLERSLAGLMMTICLMLPLLRTGSVCLTSRSSASRTVKGCPWAARGKGIGLGSAGDKSA